MGCGHICKGNEKTIMNGRQATMFALMGIVILYIQAMLKHTKKPQRKCL